MVKRLLLAITAIIFGAFSPAYADMLNPGPGTPFPVPVANGGTFCSTASGTCLDNITNWSTTGFIDRTGAGTYTFNTASQVLDNVGSTQGQVLYRSASGWSALATGSSGQCLKTGGAAANPSWGSCASSANASTITAFTTSCSTGSPCTLTLQSSTTSLRVLACGGGGGGASGDTGHTGGGGGPGYCDDVTIDAATITSPITLSVGTGGSASTLGNATCFGNGATCGTLKDPTNILYFGGGGSPSVASTSSFTGGSPWGQGCQNNQTCAGGYTTSALGTVGTGSAGATSTGISGAQPNGTAGFRAGAGASGGAGNASFHGGQPSFGPGCGTPGAAATGVASGTPNAGAAGSLLSWATYMPGCGGGGGGGNASGTGGAGGNGVNGGGGGGGGQGSSAGGTGGTGGNGFLLTIEIP